MSIAPFMAYVFVYIDVFILYIKRGFWGSNIFFVTSLQQFLAILAIKMAEFLKLEHFLRSFLKTRSHSGSTHTFRSSH